MGSNTDDDEPLSGELVRGEDNDKPVVRSPFARFSRFVFRNFMERNKLASMREVFAEEKALFKEIDGHQKAFTRLKNIKKIRREDEAALEANALAAEHRLAEERRKAAAREKDNIIFESKKDIEVGEAERKKQYELYKQDLEYQRDIKKLEKELKGYEPEPEKKTRGSPASRKQAEITKEVGRYEKEKEKIEKSDKSDAAKKTLLKAATITYQKTINAIEEKYK